MRIPVLVEPVPGKGYRARAGEPFALEAEGSTRDEALSKLRELMTRRIESGAEIVSVEVPADENPWVSFAGMFRGDPLFDEWQAVIAERREDPE